MLKFEKDFAKNTTFDSCLRKDLENELNSYIRIPRSLLNNSEISINGIILYSRLRAYNNSSKNNEWINRSIGRICNQTGIDKTHFKKELDKLIALGLIETKENTSFEEVSQFGKYKIRVVKDLLPQDKLSYIPMSCRLFWYPQLNNKMRLLYSYIVSGKDFNFNQETQIKANKLSQNFPLNRKTFFILLKKMEELEIIKIKGSIDFKGIYFYVTKDFSQSSELEEKWINKHCIKRRIGELRSIDSYPGFDENYLEPIPPEIDLALFQKQEQKAKRDLIKKVKEEYLFFEELIKKYGIYKGISKTTRKPFNFTSKEQIRQELMDWKNNHSKFNSIQAMHTFLIDCREDYPYSNIPVSTFAQVS